MNDIKSLSLLVVLLPFIAAIITGLLNKKISRNAAHTFTIIAVGLSFLISVWILFNLRSEETQNISIYTWGVTGAFHFTIGFLIDRLSALMMVVVTFVSFMVHIYTVGYMRDDPGYQRFFCYISLFTFGMLMLVMANNFLQLFFGWEMVGLMSYLLIGFWFQKESANFASMKAFLVNRVGDFGFIIGIAAIFYYFGSLDYAIVFQGAEKVSQSDITITLLNSWHWSVISFICICLFIGAMGKSAQMPLHVWLPDSMEGPTPISALIHAATMVTAGVFMIARMSPLFEFSESALNVVLIIGSLTCFLTGLLGIVQNDIKRIIAYSTLSQLGYMMIAQGASAYGIGIFHLMTHAFFKALLFLGAGSAIIAMHHEQNIWKMGNLKKYMPITYITMLVGSLSIIGFPFFAGFYSKDLIIEAAHLSNLAAAPLAYSVALGSVLITALYSFRLFFVVFHTKERMDHHTQEHLHESPAVVWVPLVLLAIPSIIAGAIFVEPLFSNFFGDSLNIHANHPVFSELKEDFHGTFNMAMHGFLSMPFYLAITGIIIAWICYIQVPSIPQRIQSWFHILYSILINKYGFDIFYQKVIATGTRGIGWICWRLGDQWAIDGIAVNGTANEIGRAAGVARKLQTGYLYHYAFAMITGFLVLLVWLLWT